MLGVMPDMGTTDVALIIPGCPGVVTLDTVCSDGCHLYRGEGYHSRAGNCRGKWVKPGRPGGLLGTILSGFG